MFKKLIINKTNNTHIQLFRSLFVGGISYAVDFGIMVFITEIFGVYYLISASISFLFGLATNYSLSTFWVFSVRKLGHKQWLEFIIFAFIGLIGLILNLYFMWLFTETFHIYYMISKIIATLFVFLWNFFSRKYILYN